MKRSATAEWRGNLKQGQGFINSESGSLSNLSYSFTKRFGEERGTSPEELIGAAHASCFAMAVSAELENQKLTAESIHVRASVNLEQVNGNWEIPAIHLEINIAASGVEENKIRTAAESAKANCPVSKLLSSARISMNLSISNEEFIPVQ